MLSSTFTPRKWKEVDSTFTGDDSALGVPFKFTLYDMTYLRSFFLRVYGMTYTSPTKSADMFVEWDDLQYLKRKFVVGHFGVMAPLNSDSLVNMVSWTEDDTRQVRESVVNSLLLEAFHYSADMYSKCYAWVGLQSQILGENWTYPSFEGICRMRAADYPFHKF